METETYLNRFLGFTSIFVVVGYVIGLLYGVSSSSLLQRNIAAPVASESSVAQSDRTQTSSAYDAYSGASGAVPQNNSPLRGDSEKKYHIHFIEFR
jgi:hypothetical protein